MSKDYGVKSWNMKTNLYTSGVLSVNSTMDLSIKISNAMNIPKNVVDKVLEVKENDRKIASKRIVSKISKELWYVLDEEDVKDIISLHKQLKKDVKENYTILSDADAKINEKWDWWLKSIASTDDKPKKYDESERHYIFYRDWEPYPVLISTVRNIRSDYSKKWADMNSDEIRLKYKLPAWIFELIRSATWLYKTSHVDDPITLSRLKSDWLEQYIDESIDKNIEDRYMAIYDRAAKGKIKNDLSKFAKSNKWYDIFLEKFETAIKKHIPIKWNNIKVPTIRNHKVRDIFITDSHFGKKGTDWIIKRFKTLTNDLLSTDEKYINITFGGDLWECLLPYWEMHPWQRLWMEDITTDELIMLIIDVFENMLIDLYKAWKVVTFNGMKWNHDRMTEHKEFDPHRTPALIVYKFLEKLLKNTSIKINILNNKANILRSGKIKYVFIHWDWLSDRELQRRALSETEDWVYLVIVSWDKHHYKMTEISDKVLRIQCPALAWQWKYDESLALSSLPWSVEFFENNSNTIDFTVKRYR